MSVLAQNEEWPERELFSPWRQSYEHVIPSAATFHHVILASLYDYPILLSSFAGQPQNHGSTTDPFFIHEMVDNITTVCVLAAYYGCLPKISPRIAELLTSHALFWQSVANKPWKYIVFGERLRNADVYFDALRHLIASERITYPQLAESLNLSTPEAKAEFGIRREEALAKQRKIEHRMLQLTMTKSWSTAEKSWTARNAFWTAVRIGWWPGRTAGAAANAKSQYLARAAWGQWLGQQIGDRCLPSAAEKVMRAARSDDPATLFGLDVAPRIAHLFSLGHLFNPPKQVNAALREVVAGAAGIIDHAFPGKNVEEEVIDEEGKTVKRMVTFRRAHSDLYDERFAYVGVDEEAASWMTSQAWMVPETAQIRRAALTDGVRRALGP